MAYLDSPVNELRIPVSIKTAAELTEELEPFLQELAAAIQYANELRETIDALIRESGPPEAPTLTLVTEPGPVLDEQIVSEPVAEPETRAPLLVPLLGFRQELILRGLVLLGVTTAAWFWMWWIGEGHGQWTGPAIAVTTLLAWASMLTLYFFFFITRMTRPNPAVAPPRLRTAMVVTKVPSEPWPMVKRTLEAALGQDFPYPYDVWLADERPDEETLRWCFDKGVAVSTRFSVEEYHQPTWPRRTKCKEGNLAYFYDTVGYERYDVVSQLDADHIPAPDYLENMIRPFRDPKVGYVSAPSICDANADLSWTVRGRLYREATLHGPVQAGSNEGYGPVCIGSHYAVRTAALRDVGGLGPELAEDFTTTLWMQSAGWDGVFNIDAEAHGDGPESLAEMMTQEVQWARSLGTVLTRYAPGKLGSVPFKARARLGFAVFFYPLQGAALLLAAVLPTFGVLFGLTWGNTSLAGFYAHLWPMSLTGIATTAYLRRQHLLRPRQAKLWSWELVLFQLIRWPWAMIGALQGMWIGWRGVERSFKVTPKGDRGVKPLPWTLIAPSLVLGLMPAWVALAIDPAGRAIGMLVITFGQGVMYLLAITVVLAIHLRTNVRALWPLDLSHVPPPRALLLRAAGGPAVLTSLVVVLATIAALVVKVV